MFKLGSPLFKFLHLLPVWSCYFLVSLHVSESNIWIDNKVLIAFCEFSRWWKKIDKHQWGKSITLKVTKVFLIHWPLISNINWLIGIDSYRLIPIINDYLFHKLVRTGTFKWLPPPPKKKKFCWFWKMSYKLIKRIGSIWLNYFQGKRAPIPNLLIHVCQLTKLSAYRSMKMTRSNKNLSCIFSALPVDWLNRNLESMNLRTTGRPVNQCWRETKHKTQHKRLWSETHLRIAIPPA